MNTASPFQKHMHLSGIRYRIMPLQKRHTKPMEASVATAAETHSSFQAHSQLGSRSQLSPAGGTPSKVLFSIR